MSGNSNLFKEALKSSDITLLKSIPKSDLHNHALLGSRLSNFSACIKESISPPPDLFYDIEEMNNYIIENLRTHIVSIKGIETSLRLAFRQAKEDGVVLLEMSIDCQLINLFKNKEIELIELIKKIHKTEAPEINFNPEIGISRNSELKEVEACIYPCIESGFFKSIDLYGNELIKDAKNYKQIYLRAKNYNLKLKSHAGEFGDAESVRYTVEVLELNEVQHGISAVNSKDVMKWLRKNNIKLNICPTSNIKLNRVKNMNSHPIRILADNGIKVTINSDDIMIFNQSVTDELINLYKSKLFSESELDILRINGLINS